MSGSGKRRRSRKDRRREELYDDRLVMEADVSEIEELEFFDGNRQPQAREEEKKRTGEPVMPREPDIYDKALYLYPNTAYRQEHNRRVLEKQRLRNTGEVPAEAAETPASPAKQNGKKPSRIAGIIAGMRERRGAADTEESVWAFEPWTRAKKRETRFVFVACLILLSVIGLIMVTSSSVYYAYNTYGDSMYYFKRQIGMLALSGGIFLLTAYVIPLEWFQKFSFLAYIVSILLLIAVMFVGEEVNGSRRWINIAGIQFQPSEFSKIATALFLCSLVNYYKNEMKKFSVFVKLMIVLVIPTVLIFRENLSTAVIHFIMGLMIIFAGGANKWYVLITTVLLGAAVAASVALPLFVPIEDLPKFLQGFMRSFYYRTERLKAWLDPFAYASDEGYQTIQSLYAVGTGGFFGKGLGQSVQKLGFIPEAHNDIIFSVLCEELGLVGAGIVLLLFGGLIWNGVKIANHSGNRYGGLLAVGMTAQVAVQAIINIAVNVNVLPVTGVTLPFISYGGTSLVFLLAGMGLVVNVARRSPVSGKGGAADA